MALINQVHVQEVCLKLQKEEFWEVGSPPHRVEPAAERR